MKGKNKVKKTQKRVEKASKEMNVLNSLCKRMEVAAKSSSKGPKIPGPAPINFGKITRNSYFKVLGGDRGALKVKGQELIGTLSSADQTLNFPNFLSVGVSPAQWGGSRIKSFSPLFEKYIFRKIKFHYAPAVSTTLPGQLILTYDRDPSDTPPAGFSSQTISELMSVKQSLATPVWKDAMMDCKLDIPTDGFFTKPERSADARFYQQGTFFVFGGFGIPQDTDLGFIWVEYEIDFFVPTADFSGEFLARGNEVTNTAATNIATAPYTYTSALYSNGYDLLSALNSQNFESTSSSPLNLQMITNPENNPMTVATLSPGSYAIDIAMDWICSSYSGSGVYSKNFLPYLMKLVDGVWNFVDGYDAVKISYLGDMAASLLNGNVTPIAAMQSILLDTAVPIGLGYLGFGGLSTVGGTSYFQNGKNSNGQYLNPLFKIAELASSAIANNLSGNGSINKGDPSKFIYKGTLDILRRRHGRDDIIMHNSRNYSVRTPQSSLGKEEIERPNIPTITQSPSNIPRNIRGGSQRVRDPEEMTDWENRYVGINTNSY